MRLIAISILLVLAIVSPVMAEDVQLVPATAENWSKVSPYIPSELSMAKINLAKIQLQPASDSYLVATTDTGFCGSGGCAFWVLVGNEAGELQSAWEGFGPGKVETDAGSHDGMRDLIFDGKRYVWDKELRYYLGSDDDRNKVAEVVTRGRSYQEKKSRLDKTAFSFEGFHIGMTQTEAMKIFKERCATCWIKKTFIPGLPVEAFTLSWFYEGSGPEYAPDPRIKGAFVPLADPPHRVILIQYRADTDIVFAVKYTLQTFDRQQALDEFAALRDATASICWDGKTMTDTETGKLIFCGSTPPKTPFNPNGTLWAANVVFYDGPNLLNQRMYDARFSVTDEAAFSGLRRN